MRKDGKGREKKMTLVDHIVKEEVGMRAKDNRKSPMRKNVGNVSIETIRA